MRICVLAGTQLKTEFIEKGIPAGVEVVWADTVKVMRMVSDIDAYFDLEFHPDPERSERLGGLNDKPFFINAVTETLYEVDTSFIRINAWPTMLKRKLSEISIHSPSQKTSVARIFEKLDWPYQLVPDVPGMITPRVVSMIINEAYYTLEQEVSSKEEIDIAMKLGTNYPFGPFEWSRQIGLGNIYGLLAKLSETEPRYIPCGLLAKEAMEQGKLSL